VDQSESQFQQQQKSVVEIEAAESQWTIMTVTSRTMNLLLLNAFVVIAESIVTIVVANDFDAADNDYADDDDDDNDNGDGDNNDDDRPTACMASAEGVERHERLGTMCTHGVREKMAWIR